MNRVRQCDMLLVATWNINGLAPNTRELETFLKVNRLDACLISEAHTTLRSRISIPGYNIYFTSHPDGGAHAGSAIAIKSSVKHCLMEQYSTDYLQATTVANRGSSKPYKPFRNLLPTASFNKRIHVHGVLQNTG